MELVKGISFKLLDLNQVKLDRLRKLCIEFQRVYNYAARMLPSFQDIRQSQSRMPIEAIRKDVKSFLYAQCTQEAIEYARSNYLTAMQSGDSIPHLSVGIVRFHNQSWSFKYHENTWYVVIPAEKVGSKYLKMWIPIKTNEFSDQLIKTTKFGVGQINVDNQTFITSYKTKTTCKLKPYIPSTFIGIDLGINNLAVLAVIDNTKKVLESKFWNGDEVKHVRRNFYRYRQSVQAKGRVDSVIKSKGYESNWMKNINHNISRSIIELAKKYPTPIIIMENLHRFKRGKIQWNFYQLREMIRYKAKAENIMFDVVDPKNTSIMCNKCGYTHADNRKLHTFKCGNCGYSLNADLNAAINIAVKLKKE